MFENRVLRRIFGPKRDGVTGEWRKLHNEELNDQYPTPHIFSRDSIKKNDMGGVCRTNGGKGEVHTGFLVGKPDNKRPLERLRGRWQDNIKMGRLKVGLEGMEWIDMAQ